MGKLKALLLTEGMHGMISQVEGMAKALGAEYSHKIVRISFPWNLIPPKFTPVSQIILKDKIESSLPFDYGLIILLHSKLLFSKAPVNRKIIQKMGYNIPLLIAAMDTVTVKIDTH